MDEYGNIRILQKKKKRSYSFGLLSIYINPTYFCRAPTLCQKTMQMQLVRVTALSQRSELHSLSNSGQSASPFELFLIEGGNALVALMWTKIKELLPLQRIIFFQHGCFLMTFPPKMHAQTASFLMPCASTRCFEGKGVVLWGTLLYFALCNTLLARKHGQREKKKKEKWCLLFCNLGFVFTSRFCWIILLCYSYPCFLSMLPLFIWVKTWTIL